MKKSKILISIFVVITAIVSVGYGTMGLLSNEKESNLKEIAIKASQNYIEENDIYVENTLRSELATLVESGDRKSVV